LPAKALKPSAGALGNASRVVEACQHREEKSMFNISYGALAIIFLLFMVLPLLLIFCLLAVSSREEAQLEKLAKTQELACILGMWSSEGEVPPEKPLQSRGGGGEVPQPTGSPP
jgi:hypothetical protein